MDNMTEKEIEAALLDENSDVSRRVEELMCMYADDLARGAIPGGVLIIYPDDPNLVKVTKRILTGA